MIIERSGSTDEGNRYIQTTGNIGVGGSRNTAEAARVAAANTSGQAPSNDVSERVV